MNKKIIIVIIEGEHDRYAIPLETQKGEIRVTVDRMDFNEKIPTAVHQACIFPDKSEEEKQPER